MDLLKWVNEYWYMILSGGAGLWWLLSLEFRIKNVKNDFDGHVKATDQMWAKIDSMQLQMTSLLQGVSRIEGRLDETRRQRSGPEDA